MLYIILYIIYLNFFFNLWLEKDFEHLSVKTELSNSKYTGMFKEETFVENSYIDKCNYTYKSLGVL